MWTFLYLFILDWLPLSVDATAIRRSVDVKVVLEGGTWSESTTFSYPGNSTFTQAAERWSRLSAPTYAAVVSPATERDVIELINLATSNGIPILAAGGRHGFSTSLAEFQGGISVDLGQFNEVIIDPYTGIMVAGGGVRFADVYDPIYQAGFELQVGTCSCPGLIGVTLGAGVGPWAGIHGLLIDALLSLRVVLADGQVLELSKKSNPDLFWAFRGAGANFGVVVSAKYQLQEQVNNGNILVTDFLVPAELNGFNATTQTTHIIGSWSYLGPEEEGLAAFQPLFDISPFIAATQVYPWNEVITTAGGGIDALVCQPNQLQIINSANVRQLNPSTYEAVFAKAAAFFLENPAAGASLIEFAMFPTQAMASVPDAETSFPWRDARAFFYPKFTFDSAQVGNETLRSAVDNFAREIRSDIVATSGYPDLSVYVNFANGDETPEQIYSADNLSRLRALKEAWDPNNVFRYYNSFV